MKSFGPEQLERSIPMGLGWLMGRVMEAKGRQELFEHQRPEILESLRQAAIIQSVESSNRIEGVTVEHTRLEPLVFGKVSPRDRSESEIVGYRKALAWIHDQRAQIPVTEKSIKRLHQLCQSVSGDAGQYKRVDNDIIEVLPSGHRRVRFQTVRVDDTPQMMAQLCLAWRDVTAQGSLPPLLTTAGFVLDFLCIHPFRDGNGRTARLLTLLLLYHQGYRVGRYISLERLIEESKEDYYDALLRASTGWHAGTHDPTPWWSYFLSIMRQSYQAFEEGVERLATHRGAKTQTVHGVVETLPHRFQISDIKARCPHISKEHIRKVLGQLRDQGELEVRGRGRGARWHKTQGE